MHGWPSTGYVNFKPITPVNICSSGSRHLRQCMLSYRFDEHVFDRCLELSWVSRTLPRLPSLPARRLADTPGRIPLATVRDDRRPRPSDGIERMRRTIPPTVSCLLVGLKSLRAGGMVAKLFATLALSVGAGILGRLALQPDTYGPTAIKAAVSGDSTRLVDGANVRSGVARRDCRGVERLNVYQWCHPSRAARRRAGSMSEPGTPGTGRG